MSIFEALYYGNIVPFNRSSVSDAEYLKNQLKIGAEREYFCGKLSLSDHERFRNLEDLISQSSKTDEIENFAYGFTMGALIMHEIMEGREKLIQNS